MRKASAVAFTATLFAGLALGIPAASASSSSYSLQQSWSGSSGGCGLSQDLLLNSADHHNYQQGHAWSSNGDYCLFSQVQFKNGTAQTSWSGAVAGSTSIWSPVTYDGPGYTVMSCVNDETTGAASWCSPKY
ncbi:hypothetical protein GCM10009665_19320 [Kitasatospora nipponensis]|uniref:Secreted protein n=1 Tax=Kitasatospora nipponensis TaxID=258049 RepID=A0ABP4GLF1_9ACTN